MVVQGSQVQELGSAGHSTENELYQQVQAAMSFSRGVCLVTFVETFPVLVLSLVKAMPPPRMELATLPSLIHLSR